MCTFAKIKFTSFESAFEVLHQFSNMLLSFWNTWFVTTITSHQKHLFSLPHCLQMAPMHVENAREVPEYEIDPSELDFTNSVCITKVVTNSFIPLFLLLSEHLFLSQYLPCSYCTAYFILNVLGNLPYCIMAWN